MNNVLSALDVTIDIINESDIVKRLNELKLLMDSDIQIKKLLDDFNDAKKEYSKDSIVTKELTATKEKLYNHPVIAEYRKLYSELNLSFVRFNKNISTLINVKKPTCSRL